MKYLSFCLLIIAFTSCDSAKNAQSSSKTISLFDGKTFKGWHNYNGTGEVKSWTIEDGATLFTTD